MSFFSVDEFLFSNFVSQLIFHFNAHNLFTIIGKYILYIFGDSSRISRDKLGSLGVSLEGLVGGEFNGLIDRCRTWRR